MVVTCDTSCDMGYIYIKTPQFDFNENCKSNVNQYIKEINLVIPDKKSDIVSLLLNKLTLCDKTYSQALDDLDIDQEYCNDLDENGYLIGIELNLNQLDFMKLIETNSFRVYDIVWKDKDFYMLTFDSDDVVFDVDNIIYPLTKDNDTFVVVKIKSKYNIGLITGLITSRNDIYPIEYLTKQQFMLLGIGK
jgi:uncharacterized protein YuzE